MSRTRNDTADQSQNSQEILTRPPPRNFVVWLWRQARRVVVFVIGSTVLLIGIIMIVGPGPAIVVIPLGLAILATEFVWAREWLAYAKRHLENMVPMTSKLSEAKMNLDSPKKSRTEVAAGYPPRQNVDETDADWSLPLTGYDPPFYTATVVYEHEGTWADPADVGAVKRPFLTQTSQGDVAVRLDEQGWPLNPLGRTGLRGRGLLGKWGRNPAGDPLLTRIDPHTSRLQVLVIERKDSGQMALPGGMVDEGEAITATVTRELFEETGASLSFDNATTIYTGVVDDPRNTDNAWMETTVLHKHLTSAELDSMSLKAGDDAASVHWADIDNSLLESLYASHAEYVRLALKSMNH